MNKKIEISIIIVNHNHPELIDQCLKSIFDSDPQVPYEIIIVDNGSSYDIEHQIELYKSRQATISIKLIQNYENIGYGKANNKGAFLAIGRYLLLLNTDTIVKGHAIDELYRFITKANKPIIVGPKLLNSDLSPQSSCGLFYTPWVTFIMLFLKGDKLGMTRFAPKHTQETDWVSGACFLIDAKIYLQLNGFDENIFMYMEEVELMYRAKKQGIRVYYYPEAKIVHIGAATSGSRKTPILNIYRGLLYFYKKHGSMLDRLVIQLMLLSKAYIGFVVGKCIRNDYLISTYGEAIEITKKA